MNAVDEAVAPTSMQHAVTFIARGRPRTSNRNVGNVGTTAQSGYARLYAAAGGAKFSAHCYALIYYFAPGYRPNHDVDAGNAHKRLIDGLQGAAFDDDEVVRLLTVGIIDYGPAASGPASIDQLDITAVPSQVLKELTGLIAAGSEHFLYVEIGPLRPTMFTFDRRGSTTP